MRYGFDRQDYKIPCGRAKPSILFHSSALSWSFSAAMFSSRCASDDVPGIAQHCSFSLLPSCLTSVSLTPASARYARFHWLWPPVELLHEERNTDCFLAACTPSPSFLHGRRLEEFPCRYESNGNENARAFRIRSKPRRGGEPRRVQRCRR